MLIDAGAHPRRARHAVVAAELITIHRRHRAAKARIGKWRVHDVQFELVKAVDALRLVVDAGRQPIVEHADAAADRRLTAGKRCPRDAETRSDVGVAADVRLELIANPRGERQILPEPDIVLNVQSRLDVAISDRRIAHAAGVVTRLVCQEGVEVVTREGTNPLTGEKMTLSARTRRKRGE